VDLGPRWAKLVGISRQEDGRALLEAAELVDVGAGEPASGSLSTLWRSVSKHGREAHCNLGPVGCIVQVFEFPAMDPEEMVAAAGIEAEQLIPNIEEMALDYQILGPPAEKGDKTAKVSILVVAAPQEALGERVKQLFSVNLPIRSVVPDGIALANAVQAMRSPATGAMVVVDIGPKDTQLVAVSRHQQVLEPFCHYIPFGMELLMGGKSAEDGATYVDGGGRTQSRERWLREIERSIEFIESKVGSPPKEVLVVGEGSESEDVLGWLGEGLVMDATPWNPLLEMDRGESAPDEDVLKGLGSHAAVAVGLALLGGDL